MTGTERSGEKDGFEDGGAYSTGGVNEEGNDEREVEELKKEKETEKNQKHKNVYSSDEAGEGGRERGDEKVEKMGMEMEVFREKGRLK
ncbi:hypothetical protein FACS189472_17540 [Alphaproteobacteria bacterium]|nr:hypothetical protein FACS189472_17540 [Alphaproteobacteria bacterium]